MNVTERIMQRARDNKRTIVLAEGHDERVVKAAGISQKEGIANIVLLGNPENIAKLAGDVSLEGVNIIDIEKADKLEQYTKELYELRKEKGMTPEQAAAQIKDELFFGAMMVRLGDADGMVAGATHTTSDTLRAALQVIKARKGIKTVSSFFVMTSPNKDLGFHGTFVFSDCGLVINPNEEELAEIAITSAETAKNLCEMDPVVIAMLSFSTKGSAKDESVTKVVNATNRVKTLRPDLIIDGELQLDAALVEAVGRSKAPGSPVPGRANVLIFPDINAGNIGYKLTQRFGNAEALGPVVQGLAKPVNDLSRGCCVTDIVKVVAITVVQSQAIK